MYIRKYIIKPIYILLKVLVNLYSCTTSELYVFTLLVSRHICVFISNSFRRDVLSNENVAVLLEIEDFQLHSKRQHRSVATMSSAMFRMNNHETWHIIYLTLSFWAAFNTTKPVQRTYHLVTFLDSK